jgi:hypothetical protein
MKHTANITFISAILIFTAGCDDSAANAAKSDSSVITPLAKNWPKTKDGITVNWLGNMVINDNEYFPLNDFATGFMKQGKTVVSMRLNQPPNGFEEIQIIPAVRLRRANGNVMYEVQQKAVRIGSRDAISYNITLSDLPIHLQSTKNGDLICDIGYYYDDKYKTACISNIPIL